MINKNYFIKAPLCFLFCSLVLNCYAFERLSKQDCQTAIKQNNKDTRIFEANQRILKSEINRTNWLPKNIKENEIRNINESSLTIRSNTVKLSKLKCSVDVYEMNRFVDKKIKDIRVTYYNLVQTSKEDSLNKLEKLELYNNLQGEENE